MKQTSTKQESNEQPTNKNAVRQFHASTPEAGHAESHSRINPRKFLTSTGDFRIKIPVVINRTLLALAVCAAIGFGGTILAQQTGNSSVKVNRVSEQDIIEKVDGKAARVTVEEVIIEPGQRDSAHRHSGAVFGYVLEGEYEHALDDEPVRTFKAGETFYEPSGTLHRVARNPSDKTRTRLLAVFLHSRDAKETTVPVKGQSMGITSRNGSAVIRTHEGQSANALIPLFDISAVTQKEVRR